LAGLRDAGILAPMQSGVTQAETAKQSGIDPQIAQILADLIAKSGFKSPLFTLVALALSGNYAAALAKIIPGHDAAFYSAICIVAFTLADAFLKWIVARHPALKPIVKQIVAAAALAPDLRPPSHIRPGS
jgi:hypothetical protein